MQKRGLGQITNQKMTQKKFANFVILHLSNQGTHFNKSFKNLQKISKIPEKHLCAFIIANFNVLKQVTFLNRN